ncbi:MAG: prolyl oligopeptidase family serine peptidase, partial [bacterium]|nr:prolyl oligopeptidase family serine peptidase [bacterium]
SKDGLYVAAAMRKPKGDGPFPALIHFHGAPGGRGMEQLTGWSRGDHGGPVWERFLAEGYVVVVADYRNQTRKEWGLPVAADRAGPVDDAVTVVDYVRGLDYVNADRITLYGVSLGGNVVAHVISRTKVHGAIFGAPYVGGFLGARFREASSSASPMERFKSFEIDEDLARKNINSIETPILILAGAKDSLIHMDRRFHDELEKAGKNVRLEIYENGYHDFVMGPQGQEHRDEPLMDATLDALELSLEFASEGK